MFAVGHKLGLPSRCLGINLVPQICNLPDQTWLAFAFETVADWEVRRSIMSLIGLGCHGNWLVWVSKKVEFRLASEIIVMDFGASRKLGGMTGSSSSSNGRLFRQFIEA